MSVCRWAGAFKCLKGVLHVKKEHNMSNYPDFIETTGYGDVQGLCGANCRHSFGPYIEGLSPEIYSQSELDEFASQTVTYRDWKTGEEKMASFYEGTQIQRYLERNVRKWKRRRNIKEAAGVDSSVERKKVREWQKRVIEFTEQTGLKRDYNRERTEHER